MGAGSFVTIKTRLGDATVMYEELRVASCTGRLRADGC